MPYFITIGKTWSELRIEFWKRLKMAQMPDNGNRCKVRKRSASPFPPADTRVNVWFRPTLKVRMRHRRRARRAVDYTVIEFLWVPAARHVWAAALPTVSRTRCPENGTVVAHNLWSHCGTTHSKADVLNFCSWNKVCDWKKLVLTPLKVSISIFIRILKIHLILQFTRWQE